MQLNTGIAASPSALGAKDRASAQIGCFISKQLALCLSGPGSLVPGSLVVAISDIQSMSQVH